MLGQQPTHQFAFGHSGWSGKCVNCRVAEAVIHHEGDDLCKTCDPRSDQEFCSMFFEQDQQRVSSDIYKEMVEVMDEGVGKIVQSLKETGQYENTIVLFISDNGANKSGNNGNLRGYKGGAYEGGSRVPAIISYPGRIKKGTLNKQIVLTMDLLPTLLDFTGHKPGAANIDGISIKDNLLHQTNLAQRDVFFAFKNESFIRSGDWKLICKEEENSNTIELYNLLDDLQERNDLSSDNPDLVNKLMGKLEVWKKEVREGVLMISE